MIYAYGEDRKSRVIARKIVEYRQEKEIETTTELAEIIYSAIYHPKFGELNPATRTFQALRIAVNGELKRLPMALHNAFNCLLPGGKMGVITFHSLEDRIVKNYFRNLGKQCVCPPEVAVCRCGGKVCAEIAPTDEEVKANSPSRSAKLRVVRKIKDDTEYHLDGVVGF